MNVRLVGTLTADNVLLAYGPLEAEETERFCSLMNCFLILCTFEIRNIMNLSKTYWYLHLPPSLIENFYGFIIFSCNISKIL